MNDTPRSELAALAGLAFAGIAAYAGYRAIDAERRNDDPSAKPLKDHVVETARSDLKRLRERIGKGLDDASDVLDGFARKAEAKADDLAARTSASDRRHTADS